MMMMMVLRVMMLMTVVDELRITTHLGSGSTGKGNSCDGDRYLQ